MIDVDAAVRDAERWLHDRFPQATIRHYRSDDERPDGWVIVARVQAFHVVGVETRLVCVNVITGARVLKHGWWEGQPIELAMVKPDWIAASHQPLPPMPQMGRSYDE